MNQGVKVILFDLGNVLIDLDYGIAVKRIAYFCKKSPKEIIDLLMSFNITSRFEEGKISPHDFYSHIKDMLDLKISYTRFVPIWNEIFFLSAKNRSVYSLANNLRNNYRIAILSNINMLHYEYIKEHFPVFDIFSEVFASCKMGLVKPEPEIYKQVIEKLDVKPEEVFYIDDREELVKGAAALEINSFVFTDFKKLKSDLISLGVI